MPTTGKNPTSSPLPLLSPANTVRHKTPPYSPKSNPNLTHPPPPSFVPSHVLRNTHNNTTTILTSPPTHLRLFGYGDLGVDIFFVISGIVIASPPPPPAPPPPTPPPGHPPEDSAARLPPAVFLYHRLARITPLFWIYNHPLPLLANRLESLVDRDTPPRSFSLIASYLLLPTRLPMLLLQGWTLSFELYFYLLIALLLLSSPERVATWLLMLTGASPRRSR